MPGLLRFRLGKRYLTVSRWTGGIATNWIPQASAAP
ncbi:hypothetical protein JLDANKMP_03887 [Stenotrophomonas sp. PE591]|nr:hypothetical protein [Stenotrophomonas sp. PE591]